MSLPENSLIKTWASLSFAVATFPPAPPKTVHSSWNLDITLHNSFQPSTIFYQFGQSGNQWAKRKVRKQNIERDRLWDRLQSEAICQEGWATQNQKRWAVAEQERRTGEGPEENPEYGSEMGEQAWDPAPP